MIADLLESPANRAMLVAVTCNTSCALVGCFLVLRRLSLMGDALSHAVLPGLVIAFLLSGSTGAGPMLLGALAAGIVTTFLTQAVERHGRVAPDASLGVVYTSLFALGVLLVKRYVSTIHFDIACVYEGSLQTVAIDTSPSLEDALGILVPIALGPAVLVLVLVLASITLLWKELKLSSFDSSLAETLGFFPGAMHYLLMLLVSLATVTSFKAIGSILVVAMLIAPAACAQLLVNRLAPMLLVAAAVAAGSTVLGYHASVYLNIQPAGMIAVTAGLFYLAAVVFSPTQGVLSRMANNLRLALQVRSEDILALLYRRQETEPQATIDLAEAHQAAGGGTIGSLATRSLARRGEIHLRDGRLSLTEPGLKTAAKLVRAHRLWESYLVDEVGIQADHVHDAAHMMEHVLDENIREEIAQQLGGKGIDPHGKEIPTQSPPQQQSPPPPGVG